MNADKLKKAMRALSEPPAGPGPPQWEYWRHELWERVIHSDNPAEFFGWPCIYHTMLVNHWYGNDKVEVPAIYQDIERWHDGIVLPDFGSPLDFWDGTIFGSTLIHQAYHLKQWEDASGRRVKDLDRIVEFGAGYGAMAYLVRKLGFQGRYMIFDTPEFALLQKFYLANVGIGGIEWRKKPMALGADLLIGLYSLGEVEEETRAQFLARCPAPAYLFLYSANWGKWDIRPWFKQFAEDHADLEWQHKLEVGLPPENWYSVGWTK